MTAPRTALEIRGATKRFGATQALAGMTLSLPMEMLSAVQVLPGVYYPIYRLVIIGATLAVALLLYFLVMRTRIGMLIRAGASNREMVGALGVNIKLLYTLVFGLGAAQLVSTTAVFALLAHLLGIPWAVAIVLGGDGTLLAMADRIQASFPAPFRPMSNLPELRAIARVKATERVMR